MIEVVGLPLCFLAYSFMTGSIYEFLAIGMVKVLLGETTKTAVYGRLIAARFDVAVLVGGSVLRLQQPSENQAVVTAQV